MSVKKFDLYSILVGEEKLHPNFIKVMADENLKKVVDSWRIGFIDRDNKFAKEFQTTFNSSLWELYLNACLKNLGFDIDFSHSAPDFIVRHRKSKNEAIIEAVISNNPKEELPEFEKKILSNYTDISEFDRREIKKLATERFLNSIILKSQKYTNNYVKLDFVQNKPFIIALGSFEQPFHDIQGIIPIQTALYGLARVDIDKNDLNNSKRNYITAINKIKNNAEISVGLFNNSEFKHISAIIFSSTVSLGKVRAVSSIKEKNVNFRVQRYNCNGNQSIFHNNISHKDHKESLLDGLMICLNPYAENPINIADFKNDFIAIFDGEKEKANHNFLISRVSLKNGNIE